MELEITALHRHSLILENKETGEHNEFKDIHLKKKPKELYHLLKLLKNKNC